MCQAIARKEKITHTAVCGYPHGACGSAFYEFLVCSCGHEELISQGGNFSSRYAGEEKFPERSHWGRVPSREEIMALPLEEGQTLHPDSDCPHEGYPCQWDGCCDC